MEDQIQKLELKITELENKLKAMGTSGAASNIDPEELKTYHKVSAQLSPQICSCSVCQVCHVCSICVVCHVCQVCQVCRVCNVCINECSCGPCIQQSHTTAGSAGFGGFM